MVEFKRFPHFTMQERIKKKNDKCNEKNIKETESKSLGFLS